MGVFHGFEDKLAAERSAMEVERDLAEGKPGGTALALLDIEKLTLAKLKEVHSSATPIMRREPAPAFGRNETYESGMEAGRSLNLDRPIEVKPGRKSIGS